MIVYDDETWVRDLVAPLNRLEPVPLPIRDSKRRPLFRRPIVVAGLVAAALAVAAGVAIADGVNPFAGIGTANHAQTAQDALPPSIVAQIQNTNAESARAEAGHPYPMGSLLPDTARLVDQLASGSRVYVISTTTAKLCVLIDLDKTHFADGCGAPLTQSEPTTIESIDLVKNGPNATPPLTFGVAQDGITSVSFLADGSEQTVPVTNNVWAYEGNSGALASLTVHYADGTTQTIAH
jgi:hypothetical protein